MSLVLIDEATGTYELPKELVIEGTPDDLRLRPYIAPSTLGHGEYEEVAVRLLLLSVEAGRWVGQSVTKLGDRLNFDHRNPSGAFSLMPMPHTPVDLMRGGTEMVKLGLLQVEKLGEKAHVLFPTSRLVRLIMRPYDYMNEKDLH